MEKENGEKALVFSTLTSVLLALTVVIGSVVILFMRHKNEKAYQEKWKDYDECGLS